ncbi:MAG: hypothetical protein OZ928_09200 [Polyangiaceae bacterium]|nr:hypothetical protein [Polyangiaceae bacterium]
MAHPRSLALAALALGAALAAGSAPRLARAEPTPKEIEAARALFTAASQHERAGDYASAADELRRALAIKETPGLRYHLAYALERQGRLAEALAEYERAGALIRGGAAAPDVEALLAPAQEALARRVPTLELRLSPAGAELRVTLDGAPLAPAELAAPLRLDPGEHLVEATAPGYRRVARRVTLAEGDARSETLELARAPAALKPAPAGAPAAAPAADTSSLSTGSPARWLVIGGEAALTVTALTFGLAYTAARSNAAGRADDASLAIERLAPGDSAACVGPTAKLAAPCGELARALDDHASAGRVATGSFIVAGAGAASVVLTLLLWPRRSSASVGLAPLPAGGLAGSVAGAF